MHENILRCEKFKAAIFEMSEAAQGFHEYEFFFILVGWAIENNTILRETNFDNGSI